MERLGSGLTKIVNEYDKKELLEMRDIGPEKAENFGRGILAIIKAN